MIALSENAFAFRLKTNSSDYLHFRKVEVKDIMNCRVPNSFPFEVLYQHALNTYQNLAQN